MDNEFNKKEVEQSTIKPEQIGPIKKEIIQYNCEGCKFLYDKSITVGNNTLHQYFCQHLEKLGFINGKSIGSENITPDWCPELIKK